MKTYNETQITYLSYFNDYSKIDTLKNYVTDIKHDYPDASNAYQIMHLTNLIKRNFIEHILYANSELSRLLLYYLAESIDFSLIAKDALVKFSSEE